MNFVQATSRLIEGLTLEDVANEIGVSHGLLRLSRLDPANPSYRPPPADWQAAVTRLAQKRSQELGRLADQLGDRPAPAARKRSAGAAAKRAKGRKRAAGTTARRKRAARR